ncbi:hypothetical protein ACNKHO_13765 [Shigella flexneri]
MRRDLIKAGVARKISCWITPVFRTLTNSIVHTARYSTNDFIIITQRFHCERALFIALHMGVSAVLRRPRQPKDLWSVRLREFGARSARWLTFYLLEREPRFLGPLIRITASSRCRKMLRVIRRSRQSSCWNCRKEVI